MTSPIARAAPPSHGIAKSAAVTGLTRTVCRTQSGTCAARNVLERPTALEDDVGHEPLEVGQDEEVGDVPGSDGAVLRRGRATARDGATP